MNHQDQQAFPVPGFEGPHDNTYYPEQGMTIRDYALIHIMAGYAANPGFADNDADFRAALAASDTDAILLQMR